MEQHNLNSTRYYAVYT